MLQYQQAQVNPYETASVRQTQMWKKVLLSLSTKDTNMLIQKERPESLTISQSPYTYSVNFETYKQLSY